jgi:hypothetical protein
MPVATDMDQASSSEAAANPVDLLTAAMDTEEVTEAELEVVDASLDAMMLGESAASFSKGKPLLSVEQAQAQLSPEILKVLAEKFKGSLTQMRHPDERDQIF